MTMLSANWMLHKLLNSKIIYQTLSNCVNRSKTMFLQGGNSMEVMWQGGWEGRQISNWAIIQRIKCLLEFQTNISYMGMIIASIEDKKRSCFHFFAKKRKKVRPDVMNAYFDFWPLNCQKWSKWEFLKSISSFNSFPKFMDIIYLESCQRDLFKNIIKRNIQVKTIC